MVVCENRCNIRYLFVRNSRNGLLNSINKEKVTFCNTNLQLKAIITIYGGEFCHKVMISQKNQIYVNASL